MDKPKKMRKEGQEILGLEKSTFLESFYLVNRISSSSLKTEHRHYIKTLGYKKVSFLLRNM